MRKLLIHSEQITVREQKIFFQIKLPSTAKEVTGIFATVSPIEEAQEPPLPPNPFVPQKVENVPAKAGSLQLMLPEQRDTFFSETLFFPNHLKPYFSNTEKLGLSEKADWWFSGTKTDFFKIKVSAQQSLIEGFYKDEMAGRIANYTVRVYLELRPQDAEINL